jgi:acyl carrier protein
MEATGCTRQELHPDMDLSRDLSLRSSRFPLIMHEVEQRFGLALGFDDLLGVATIRDLARRIYQLRHAQTHRDSSADNAVPKPEDADKQYPTSICHFSHFRELWLTDAHPWPDSPHACLPPSMQLAALMEGVARIFPALKPAGAEELSFSTAECPFGLTREGHVHCRLLPAQTEQRQCQSELRLRDLLPNGRATRSYSPISAARILLMPNTPKALTPILQDPDLQPVSASAMPAGQEILQHFYERQTGLGPRWRLLTELYALEEKRLLARMRVPTETDIAGLENTRYMYPVYVFEAAAHAALLLALQRISGQDANPRLALLRVAAAYFSRNCIPGETLGIELREDADGPRNRQFDAELRDHHGHIVLALRGICPGAA